MPLPLTGVLDSASASGSGTSSTASLPSVPVAVPVAVSSLCRLGLRSGDDECLFLPFLELMRRTWCYFFTVQIMAGQHYSL